METINHRLLVQELHDSKVLHRMLGLDSAAEVRFRPSDAPESNGTSQVRAAKESVQSTWEHADAEHDAAHGRDAEPDVEESRYGIDKRQPPSKRRRVGAEIDMHTVYTTDDDEDSEEDGGEGVVVHTVDSGSGTGEEEDEYDVSFSSNKSEKTERKRSYWLSKGVAM